MNESLELMKAKSVAGDLEIIPWWKSKMSSLTSIGCAYVKGEARRYYRDGNGRYYYRRITENEMYRRT